MTTDSKVVMFVDVLGFAALTESYPIDIDLFKAKDRIGSLSFDAMLNLSSNPLVNIFSGFHHLLKSTLNIASMSHPLTAITFSDSAFIATTYASEAISIAIDLIRWSFPRKIPVRIGIAYGSFVTLRFSSDVTSDSGDHSVHFLGTAVVRAHATEKCGIKGIRILLHPSVIPLLDNIHHNNPKKSPFSHLIRPIECSENERINTVGAQYEINYWDFRPTMEAEAWHGLQDMWNKAPQSEEMHYIATAEAINRMRIAQGYKSLNKIRRRTLSKEYR